MAGLLFDLCSLAPNTKLLSSKVTKALKILLEQKTLEIPAKYGTPSDVIDKIDISVRLLLGMMRNMKLKRELKCNVYRLLSRKEQTELDMIFEQVQLPPELMAQGSGSFEDDECFEGIIEPEPAQPPLLALPAPPIQPLQDKKVSPPKGKPSVRNDNLSPVPVIFQDIIDGKRQKTSKVVVPSSGSSPCQAETTEAAVLANAMGFVPCQVAGKPKAKQSKKAGKHASKASKGKKKPQSKAKTCKPHKAVAKPQKTAAKKTKSKAGIGKEKTASKAAEKPVDIANSSFEIPDDAKTYSFKSSVYGDCKLEMYSAKSYIRKKEPASKKWISIIGCCDPEHHAAVCRQLLPYVAKGLAVSELYEHRQELLFKMKCVD